MNVACTSGYLHGGKNENRKLLRFVRVGHGKLFPFVRVGPGGNLHDLVLVDIPAGGLEIKENQERRHRNREQERGSPATEALPQDVTSVTGVPCGSNVPTRQQRGETVSFSLVGMHCDCSAPLFFRTMAGIELGDLLFYLDQKQIVTPGSHVHAVERYPEELREIHCKELKKDGLGSFNQWNCVEG